MTNKYYSEARKQLKQINSILGKMQEYERALDIVRDERTYESLQVDIRGAATHAIREIAQLAQSIANIHNINSTDDWWMETSVNYDRVDLSESRSLEKLEQ